MNDLRKARLLIYMSLRDDGGVVVGRLQAAMMLLGSVIGHDSAGSFSMPNRGPVRNLRLAIDLIQRKHSYGEAEDGMLDAVVDILVPAIETIEDAEMAEAR